MDMKRTNEIIERTNKVYNSSKGGALIQIKEVMDIPVPKRGLDSFGLPNNMETYLDFLIFRDTTYWNLREDIQDDIIPSTTARYGIAEHSAFMGGEVSFTDRTSWHHQEIFDYSDYKLASVDESNLWRNLVVEGMKYMKSKVNKNLFIRYRGIDGPLDVVNALRGNDFFYDFYDDPDALLELSGKCTDAIIYLLKEQALVVDEYQDYVISGFDVLLPKGYAGHLSVDATTMLSDELFREFEVPYLEKIANSFDGVFFHIHSVGGHVIPAVAEVGNIKFIEISNDPNAPRGIEVYKQYEKELRDKITIATLSLEEIEANIDFLKDRKTVIWYDAKTTDEAKRAVDLVRSKLG